MRHKLYRESLELWRVYEPSLWRRKEGAVGLEWDEKAVHPLAVMLRICSYNISRPQFRSLGQDICTKLAARRFLDSQQLFDCAMNFWSGNDEVSASFVAAKEAEAMSGGAGFVRSDQTYCALLRSATRNGDRRRALRLIAELEQEDDVAVHSAANLVRIVFNSHFVFGAAEESLTLLRRCVLWGDQYAVSNGTFSVLKTFVAAQRFETVLAAMLRRESDLFEAVWNGMGQDAVSLLMYCCLRADDVHSARRLMEFAMDRNLTAFSMVTLNHFVHLLVRTFGPWSDVVMEAVAMLLIHGDNGGDGGGYTLCSKSGDDNAAILNVYDLSAAVIPSVVRCFIESAECSRFSIVWYRNAVRNKATIQRDNYRLLSGEDSDYLLSRTHFVLQNHFYPPIQCRWTFGHDEIHCDATNFVNALRSQ